MKINISGNGAMGQMVNALALQHDHQVLAIAENAAQYDTLFAKQAHVVIDFSHPANLNGLLTWCRFQRMPVVLATTGYSDQQRQQIAEAAEHIAILQSYNMSYSMSIFAKALAHVKTLIDDSFDIEIIEKHHNKKIDAPSGTAHLLYDILKGDDSQPCYNYRDLNGRNKRHIGLHAVRGGTIFGEHEVIFAGDDEVISLSHQALSKRIFASGALKGAQLLMNKTNGLYTLKDLF